ncbi:MULTISPECIES: RecQ family ATP-dependent DNA helicase [Enterococcus]|uniref:RecQ family ATP-dependent DNA helicase n=1 Tax=Enterococcus TaxID=1350 RepID=UPI0020903FB1|nr:MULTISPECIES: ATP-dependent DNA helicase RecQ [Enterococcus]MCO5429785.1 ATP-dependent DNA helicase [Enterococcus faecium]
MLINELKKYFGFDSFRPGQEEIIQALLDGEDTLAILPTGTGKSLCYQLTGYLTDGMVLIVSPLLSLMEDQVTQLQKRGEKRVAAFNSLLSRAERGYVLRHLSQYKFLFLSPEMLTNPSLLEQLKKQDIALYVVDEAHCVSQWGVDFRPEYQQLGKIREHLGNPVTLALTATATDLVAKDIRQVLFDRQPKEVRQSVNRQNISLFVRKTQQKEQELEQFMESAHGAAIIYCATKKEVERLYHLFRERFSVGHYHGGLDTAQRRQLQQQFVKNQLQFLIATNAFGMGIDKSDIRYVIHYDLPDSLENYVQEIGRAGRDQEESAAILLYQSGDERIHYFFNQLSREQRQSFELYLEYAAEQAPFDELQKKWMELIQQSEKPENWVERLKRQEKEKEFRLQQMLRYIHEEDCRRKFILAYFGEELSKKPQNCCDIDGAKVELLPKKKAFSKTEPLHWESILLNLFKKNMEH